STAQRWDADARSAQGRAQEIRPPQGPQASAILETVRADFSANKPNRSADLTCHLSRAQPAATHGGLCLIGASPQSRKSLIRLYSHCGLPAGNALLRVLTSAAQLSSLYRFAEMGMLTKRTRCLEVISGATRRRAS